MNAESPLTAVIGHVKTISVHFPAEVHVGLDPHTCRRRALAAGTGHGRCVYTDPTYKRNLPLIYTHHHTKFFE